MKYKSLLFYVISPIFFLTFFIYKWNTIRDISVNVVRYPPSITTQIIKDIQSDLIDEIIQRNLFKKASLLKNGQSKSLNSKYSDRLTKKSDSSKVFNFRLMALAMRADGLLMGVVLAHKSDGNIDVRSYVQGDKLPNGASVVNIDENSLTYENNNETTLLLLFHKDSIDEDNL